MLTDIKFFHYAGEGNTTPFHLKSLLWKEVIKVSALSGMEHIIYKSQLIVILPAESVKSNLKDGVIIQKKIDFIGRHRFSGISNIVTLYHRLKVAGYYDGLSQPVKSCMLFFKRNEHLPYFTIN